MPASSLSRVFSQGLAPFVAVLALTGGSTNAQSEIYRCELANGVVEYNNTPTAGKDRTCKKVDLPQITTIPAPKIPAAAAQTQGGVRPAGNVPTTTAARSSSPSDFPKVDGNTQKVRDNDRRRIIEDELKREEGKLSELKKGFNNGEPERQGDERNYQRYQDRVQKMRDEITRSESNVGSLKKELASVRD